MPARKNATTAVAKKPNRSVEAISNFDTGFETVETDLIQIPRLKIVQKTSEEFDQGVPMLSFVNSVTKDIICKGKKDGAEAVVIPFSFARSRLYFASMKEGGQLKCQSLNGIEGQGDPGGVCHQCPMRQWEEDEPPRCSEVLNFFCIVRDHDYPLPLAVSFMKTSYGEGRKFYNMLVARRQQGLNPAAFTYLLKSKAETSDKGTYGVYKIAPEGKSTDEEFKQALQYIEFLSNRKTQVDYEPEARPDGDPAFS